MSVKVYLVNGCLDRGSDDLTEWLVCAYTTAEQARDHVVRANGWIKERSDKPLTQQEQETLTNPHDRRFAGQWPRWVRWVHYWWTEEDLYRHVDEYTGEAD